ATLFKLVKANRGDVRIVVQGSGASRPHYSRRRYRQRVVRERTRRYRHYRADNYSAYNQAPGRYYGPPPVPFFFGPPR
ncbi:MAG: hypothetical protein P8Y53_15060, partial [Pseudolabrys sp.]